MDRILWCDVMWHDILSHLVNALQDCAEVSRSQFSVLQEELTAIHCGAPQLVWVCIWTLIHLCIHWHALWRRESPCRIREQLTECLSVSKLYINKLKHWVNFFPNQTRVKLIEFMSYQKWSIQAHMYFTHTHICNFKNTFKNN